MLISSDSHVVEPGELWVENLPARYRDVAPRAIQDPQNHHWYFHGNGQPRGVDLTLSRNAGIHPGDVDRMLADDPTAWVGAKGGHDPVARLHDNWVDGVVADVVYPTAGLSLLTFEDPGLQLACFRVYNEWIADFCATDKDRLLGLAQIPTWDIEQGVAELTRAKEAGLSGGIIWTAPPTDESFFNRRYDPLWAAAAELKMPLSIHILAGHRGSKALAKYATSVEATFYFGFLTRDEVIRSICEMIASGVFERYPDLRIVAAEGGIEYGAILEQRLDDSYTGFWSRLDSGLTMLPSEYFRRNVYCTYISDRIGLNNLTLTGADHFMWSSDYPHGAATWPHSQETVTEECAEFNVDEETIRKLTVTNCASLYGIDLDVVKDPSPLITDKIVELHV
jgi:predicted TIM-barrel fold metal-dependent hydrolase